ncbi:MAG: U32 family peptidase [Clostridia bacterium]|nr:U32 family peptidase [Clostridia bacterium]
MTKVELLAPAGDMEKLKTAIHFGADAVYFAGKNYGLRAFSTNFESFAIKDAVDYVHAHGKKAYVTINVYARDNDFDGLGAYLQELTDANVDAVLVSDMGIFSFIRKNFPKMTIHISTQANTTNKYAVQAYKDMGASRVVLARELNLDEIKKMHEFCPDMELEAFVHGALCISYSGRCLLSNYLAGRDSNHGECVQACRWKYYVTEENRLDQPLEIQEDERGTYIFNSKDLRLIEHIDKIIDAGVVSLKVEGRMKSPYYVATVVNSYRRAIDYYYDCKQKGKPYHVPADLIEELNKASHRAYTTGFMIDDGNIKQNYETTHQEQDSKFIAIVVGVENDRILVEQRNKFESGETLEILSPNLPVASKLKIEKIENQKGQELSEAKNVQEKVYLYGNVSGIEVGDILRK